jgi:hypothetical protein
LVEQHREIKSNPKFDDACDGRIEQRIEHRKPEHRIVGKPLVILQADELAILSDAGVGEGNPDAEQKRIGKEQDQECCRRHHEPQAEPIAVGDKPRPWDAAGRRSGRFECEVGHDRKLAFQRLSNKLQTSS